MKKLKEFDAITVSTGNGNADSGEHGRDHRLSDRFVDIRGHSSI